MAIASAPLHASATRCRDIRDCAIVQSTAFVERLNLTIRQSVAALIRRTWATMQDAPQLLFQMEWWRAYYHFVRPHVSLRVTLGQPIARRGKRVRQRYRQRTPAMAAGLTRQSWRVCDLLMLPLAPAPIGTGQGWGRRAR